jgi:hypothetical protein
MEESPESSNGSQSGEEIHWRFSQIKGIIEEQPTDGMIILVNLRLSI